MRLLLVALMLAFNAAGQAPVPCRGKLSQTQLEKLIAAKVAEPRLVQIVSECGVGFAWDERVHARLSRVGATRAVLAAVRFHAEMAVVEARSKPDAPKEQPIPEINEPPDMSTPPSHLESAGLREPPPAPGSVRVNTKDGLPCVWIPPGTFTMGCSPGDSECVDREEPAHQVTITQGFWMGQTSVTQAAYKRVTGQNPSHFQGSNRPVETVSWNDAQHYCQAVGMRLPTEAEWEYAVRAGSTESRYGELDEIAWYNGNSGSQTHGVGQKRANPWNLHDMLGNVWEWCEDWYGDYGPGSQQNPTGPRYGTLRVIRGGSWVNISGLVRVSLRFRIEPAFRDYILGFRCAGELR